MKVLKKGRKQKGWAAEFKCTGVGNGGGGCGALLLVEQDDLRRSVQSSCGDREYHVTFVCSQCFVLTDIDHRYPGSWAILKDL